MTISYPLTPPNNPAPQTVAIRPSAVTGISASPYTGQQQVYQHQAQIWNMDVRLPPMKREQVEPWIAFLLSLHGRYGTFYYGDPSGRIPRGVATGTPLVNGASQTGQILITDGWTSGITGILKAGDYVQFGTELHRVLADVNSDGGGNATIDIWPRIRVSPANNASIIIRNTVGLWRMTSDESAYEVTNPFYVIQFSCVEAL